MNKYQEALNKIVRSCCPYCYDDNGCQNCEIKQTCNATAKSWVDTLQELVDKETPMKVDKNTKGSFPNYDKDDTYHTTYKCPKCNCTIHLDWHEQRNFCPECAVKLDWSDTDE